MDIPDVVRVGHDARLNCDYDLEGERLYQVKWYKGTHEFYRQKNILQLHFVGTVLKC